MIRDGPFPLLEIFLVRLASQFELFMSFLSPSLHPFLSHSFVMPSFCSSILTSCWTFRSLIVLCLKPWFVSTNDLLLVRAYGLLIWLSTFYECVLWLQIVFYDTHLLPLCFMEFFHPCWMNYVFFAQSYWSSSCALLYFRFEFTSWLIQIELRVSCRG